jgi:tetraacyldisaccharide 4'-kinase
MMFKNFPDQLKKLPPDIKLSRRMPKFWQKKSVFASILPDILIPFSVIYYSIVLLRNRRIKPEKLTVPVICAGNFTAGGAGKTPLAMKIAEEISKSSQKKIAFVSRGYGGTNQGPLKVDMAAHGAEDVGDEPLLLARIAETWIGKDRLETAKAAIANGAKIIVMDDGLQNPTVEKDLSLVAIDGGFGLGNSLVIPSGPLREPLMRGLKRADAVVFIGNDKNDELPFLSRYTRIIRAKLQPVDAESLKGKKAVAFAGIGRPEKFFETLENIGVQLIDKIPFLDHHFYRRTELLELIEHAEKLDCILITTEKDYVRLPANLREKILAVPVKLEIPDRTIFDALLQPYL